MAHLTSAGQELVSASNDSQAIESPGWFVSPDSIFCPDDSGSNTVRGGNREAAQ